MSTYMKYILEIVKEGRYLMQKNLLAINVHQDFFH